MRALVARDGTWRQSWRNGPWGKPGPSTPHGGVYPLRYRWTGREWDAESGLYYFRARYYDPGQRRFLQEDPIGYAGGTNVYAYVAGRPLEATDPFGMVMATLSKRFSASGGGGWDSYRIPDLTVWIDIETIALPRIPVVNTMFTPRCGGGGGGGGGGGPSGSANYTTTRTQSSPIQEPAEVPQPIVSRRCAAAAAIAAVTLASDLAALSGAYAVVRLGLLAFGTGRAAGIAALDVAAREMAAGTVAASDSYWWAAASKASRAGAGYATSSGSSALIGYGNGFGARALGFVPGFATYFAASDAYSACTE